jgi:hypothetical protein
MVWSRAASSIPNMRPLKTTWICRWVILVGVGRAVIGTNLDGSW